MKHQVLVIDNLWRGKLSYLVDPEVQYAVY